MCFYALEASGGLPPCDSEAFDISPIAAKNRVSAGTSLLLEPAAGLKTAQIKTAAQYCVTVGIAICGRGSGRRRIYSCRVTTVNTIGSQFIAGNMHFMLSQSA